MIFFPLLSLHIMNCLFYYFLLCDSYPQTLHLIHNRNRKPFKFYSSVMHDSNQEDHQKLFAKSSKLALLLCASLFSPIYINSDHSLGLLTTYARNLPIDNGAKTANRGKAITLKPIIRFRGLFASSLTADSLKSCKDQLSQFPSEEKEFKRYFDEFSDGVSYKQTFMDQNAFLVYYTKGFDGPGRPSLEAEDLQSTRMTQQYGYRNDAWVALDDARSEVDYLIETKQERKEDRKDLLKALNAGLAAVDGYLSLSPPNIYQEALQD